MIKTIKPLLISSIFIAGISTASAALIDPALMNDFEDGSVSGWTAGDKSLDKGLLPQVVSENGNKYLKIQAFANDNGKRNGANRRMAFFNKSYTAHKVRKDYTSDWAGDYSNISAISGDFKASSTEESVLYLRLNFIGHDGKFYSSKDPFVLNTDDQWNNFSFALNAENFFVNAANDGLGDAGEDFKTVGAAQFAAAITGVEEIKFVSNKDYPQWSDVDVVRADLGVDNLKVVSAVPVPGAVWLMISGLVGLGSFSAKKRHKV
jgi:hypothetical protein